jgi:hypothetical protein
MFCDATGVTKAHVFAKSWTSLFDEPNDTREHRVAHHYTDPDTGERRLMKRAKTFALWSRNVCGACNSGWLNKLEERVKPLMAHFAADTPVVLGADEQADLALWASIATLVAMSSDPQAVNFANPELARTLYRTRRPTAGMDIWLGANSHGEMGWFRSHTLNIAHVPDKEGAWGATISFGYVVIHIVCHDIPSQRMRLKGDAQRSMRRIWGTHDRVAWPPRLRWRAQDFSPLAILVGEQSSFERAVPRRAA